MRLSALTAMSILCLATSVLATAAAAPRPPGANDLLVEGSHRCRNPRTGKVFAGWDYPCNEESTVTFAGAFACQGRRVEVFSYVHVFETFAGSGNFHGGQRLVLLVDGRLLGESEGLATPPFYRLRVDSRGVGTFRTLERRDDGKTTERATFCGPEGLARGFYLEGDYFTLPVSASISAPEPTP